MLGTLLDANLVYRSTQADPEPRYSMLESLRQFGEERLEDAAETDAVRSSHADYLLELANRLAPELTGADQAAALDRIAAEHDNLRAALAYLLETRPTDALHVASGLWRFWQMRGHLVEGADWLARALEAAGTHAPEAVRADALTAAGGLAYWRGDMKETERHYAAALKLRRKLGDDVRIADAAYDLAFVFAPHLNPPPEDPKRTARAISLLDEAEERYQAADDAGGLAKAGWLAGMVMMYRDLEEASVLLGASVERFRALNDPFGLGWALRMYGLSLLGTGHVDAAASAFDEALRLFAAADDGTGIGLLLDDWSELATAQGDLVRAARLKGAAASVRNLTDAELSIANDSPWRVQGSVGDALVDPSVLETARAEGRAMSQVEATAYALETVPEGSDGAMRVTVLGSFHAERSGATITNWGGPKAGSRQALAMFAFLMDRAERGVAKDELIEIIWPDADLSQGDLNFHRTLSGLRTVLEPERTAEVHEAVRFANGRYRLSPSVIGWSDVAEFERRLGNAASATDPTEAIRALEAARSLYGGDYLDDCPIYGDSSFVEEHRALLRGRCTDALLDLGRRYEERGEQALAAMRFREALVVSSGDCPEAASGLERLGVAAD